jgi:hypothetical protein
LLLNASEYSRTVSSLFSALRHERCVTQLGRGDNFSDTEGNRSGLA